MSRSFGPERNKQEGIWAETVGSAAAWLYVMMLFSIRELHLQTHTDVLVKQYEGRIICKLWIWIQDVASSSFDVCNHCSCLSLSLSLRGADWMWLNYIKFRQIASCTNHGPPFISALSLSLSAWSLFEDHLFWSVCGTGRLPTVNSRICLYDRNV